MSLADDIATVRRILDPRCPEWEEGPAFEALDRIEAAITGPVELEQSIREIAQRYYEIGESPEVDPFVAEILSAVRSQPVTQAAREVLRAWHAGALTNSMGDALAHLERVVEGS